MEFSNTFMICDYLFLQNIKNFLIAKFIKNKPLVVYKNATIIII